jgi:NMD protein affecting ribosome stability and mRNA decay
VNVTTCRGAPVREPAARSIHDVEATEPDAPLCNECGDETVSRDGAICAECMLEAGYCPSGHPLDSEERCRECEAEEAADWLMDAERDREV